MANPIERIGLGQINNGTQLIISDLSLKYIKYEIVFSQLYATGASASDILLRTSTDNGATFMTASNSYQYDLQRASSVSGTVVHASGLANAGSLVANLSNLGSNYTAGNIQIFNPMNPNSKTSVFTRSGGKSNIDSSTHEINIQEIFIQRAANEANNAVQIYMRTGGFTMHYLIYGYLA